MNPITILSQGEYSNIICKYFQQSFPKVAKISNSNLLEILTTILIGTKDTRYGSLPSIESQFTIRKTIMDAIEMKLPIPMLFPWGGRKMDPKLSIDIAEVSAIKQMLYLDETSQKFHEPGLLMNIAIEDTGARWLYNSEDGIQQYSSDMSKLVTILKGDSKMHAILESNLMDTKDYFRRSAELADLLYIVITALENGSNNLSQLPAWHKLNEIGWKGEIPKEQRHYYLERYERLYPGRDKSEYIQMLANYFGGSKARYEMHGRGEPKTRIGSYIGGSFTSPIPGAPPSLFNKNLYYRTIPESYGRTHKLAGIKMHTTKFFHSMQIW